MPNSLLAFTVEYHAHTVSQLHMPFSHLLALRRPGTCLLASKLDHRVLQASPVLQAQINIGRHLLEAKATETCANLPGLLREAQCFNVLILPRGKQLQSKGYWPHTLVQHPNDQAFKHMASIWNTLGSTDISSWDGIWPPHLKTSCFFQDFWHQNTHIKDLKTH